MDYFQRKISYIYEMRVKSWADDRSLADKRRKEIGPKVIKKKQVYYTR